MSTERLSETYAQAPELLAGFEELEAMRQRRAEIALTAARYIVEQGGITQDPRLYYAAMYGRSYEEGSYEHDEALLTPRGIASSLRIASKGDPLLVRAVNYPDHNATVGITASFSDEVYEPTRYVVSMEQDDERFHSWRGYLGIAMKEVVPAQVDGERTFALADEVSEIAVCETAAWTLPWGGLEVHSHGTGGVEVGENTHLNSEFGSNYHDKMLFWLRQHLAPTERKKIEWDGDRLRSREIHREIVRQSAEEQSISEGHAAAQGLSPTIAGFFSLLEPYASRPETPNIDVKALFASWRDPYDARDLLYELEFRELVGEDSAGNLVVSELGKEAMKYLHEV